MTKIDKRTIERETAAVVAGEPLIITLLPKSMYIRRKGKKGGAPVSYERIYELALKLEERSKL